MLHCNQLLNLNKTLVKGLSKVHNKIKVIKPSKDLDQELLKISPQQIIHRNKWYPSQQVNLHKILEDLGQLYNNNNNPNNSRNKRQNRKVFSAKDFKTLNLHLELHLCKNLQPEQASSFSPLKQIASLARHKLTLVSNLNVKFSLKFSREPLAAQSGKAKDNPHLCSHNPSKQCNQNNKFTQFNPKIIQFNNNKNLMTATNTWSSHKTTRKTTKFLVKRLLQKVNNSLNLS